MLSDEEISHIYRHALVPEHLPHYVEAISSAEAHIHDGFLCYTGPSNLLFVGYPLGSEDVDLGRVFESACLRFRPQRVTLIAPTIWLPEQCLHHHVEDTYFVMDLPCGPLDPETAYMIRRAQREVTVNEGHLGKEHLHMIDEFCQRKGISRGHREIFSRIPDYISSADTARLLEARTIEGGRLVSFLIFDIGSANYAFYMFHFRSLEHHIPGASDLLFHQMLLWASAVGKTRINLGLGINQGVRRFKEKWGGVPMSPYHSAVLFREGGALESLIQKL
jgi:hypothetical protein